MNRFELSRLSWSGADQPETLPLGIERIDCGGRKVPVARSTLLDTPFFNLSVLARTDSRPDRKVLVVPPISGHFTPMLRDVIVGLLADWQVHVIDWINVRHVPLDHGTFGFDENIDAVARTLREIGGGADVLALCQAGTPALAATAMLAQYGDPCVPRALVLVAAPIDPLANPTGVVRLIRGRPLSWFQTVPLWPVANRFEGRGRMVYPAWIQLAGLNTYLMRRVDGDTEIARKLRHDDGEDPDRFPFLELYTSVMDIDGRHFVENVERVFHDRLLWTDGMELWGSRVDPRAITSTALMTVEGALDDIAAPGQTSAAHKLCPDLPDGSRARLVVPGCGHFSLFHGDIWRNRVLPEIRGFLMAAD